MSQKRNRIRKPASGIIISEASAQLELTAYQRGNAVVRDRRDVSLSKGRNLVQLAGLPTQYVPNSLTITQVQGEGSFKPGTISYRPGDLSNPAILKAAVGSKVTFLLPTQDGFRPAPGTLKQVYGNMAILETEEGTLVLPVTNAFLLDGELPAGLSAVAAFVMRPTVTRDGLFGIHTLYETRGISWKARYEVFYDSSAEKLSRLLCWVDIANRCGVKIENAKATLLAGANDGDEPSYGHEAVLMAAAPKGGRGVRAQAAAEADFDNEPVEVYKAGENPVFLLPEPLTVEDGQTEHACLLLVEGVPVKHEYYLADQHYYQHQPGASEEDLPKLPVYVRLRGKNDKDSNLGTPLPAGKVKIFEKDTAGSLQKTDGAYLEYTAEDQPFKLEPSNPVKDLTATRELTYFHEDPKPEEPEDEGEEDGGEEIAPVPPEHFPIRPLGGPGVGTPEEHSRLRRKLAESGGKGKKKEKKEKPRYREEERKVTVFNYKDKDVEVLVTENFPAKSDFLSKTQEFADQAQGSGVFKIAVPAKGKAEVSYRIKYRIN